MEATSQLTRAIVLLRCAEADLRGILPEFEPSGDRTHPAWKTLGEIGEFLKDMEKGPTSKANTEGSLLKDALEVCRALVSAHTGGQHGELIDWDDLAYAHKLAVKVVEGKGG